MKMNASKIAYFPGSVEKYSSITETNNWLIDSAESSAYFFDKRSLNATLYRIFSKRRTKNWDGYDARPISRESCQAAELLISRFPSGIEFPDIFPTSVGGYSIEWDGRKRHLSIEIENCEISCVYLDEERKTKKTLFIENFIQHIDGGEFGELISWIRDGFSLND